MRLTPDYVMNAMMEATIRANSDTVARVVEIIEKHLDANGERRTVYRALRLLRKDIIEELSGKTEEEYDQK